MKLLSFATGNLYRFLNEVNLVEFVNNLNVDGIEYTYGKHYDERPLSRLDESILLSKKDVSMHVPFKIFRKPETFDKDIIDFKNIILDYKKVNAKRLVIHPNQISNDELLSFGRKQGVQYITENLRKRHGNDKHKQHQQRDFETILNQHKDFGLCLDISHAYSWSQNETKYITETWKDKIMQIHFSITHYTKGHLGTTSASKNFIKSIKCINELNVPIIIEEDMNTINKKTILNEIKSIRKITES